jgi:hypothetical protein
MQSEQVEQVVAGLQGLGMIAGVWSIGVGRTCVRVVLPGGAEALWDTDGAAGLEAQVMRDGVLVGFCPLIPGSADFTVPEMVYAIARAEYVGG